MVKESLNSEPPDLTTILINGDDLPEQYRLDEVTRVTLIRYLKAFHIQPELAAIYLTRGSDAVESILESGTYFGFVIGLKRKPLWEPYGPRREHVDVSIGYRVGWMLSRRLPELDASVFDEEVHDFLLEFVKR